MLAAAADAVLVAHQAYPATIAGNPKAWGARLAYVVRVDSRVSVAHVVATLAV